MSTAAQHMTIAEFAAHAARHGRCELIRGELHEMSPTGGRHGQITSKLHVLIGRFVYDRRLGNVYAAETGFRLGDAGRPTVRAPDIAYICASRAAAADTESFITIAPDLAVETLSPDDRANDVEAKVQWWLDHGTRLVWVVDPANRTLTAHEPTGRSRRLREHETLDAGDVLPGFTLELTKLFA